MRSRGTNLPSSPCQVYYSSSKETAVEDFVPTDDMTRTTGSETTITLNDLVPNTMYTIEVSAVNGAGEGERSGEVTAETDPAGRFTL